MNYTISVVECDRCGTTLRDEGFDPAYEAKKDGWALHRPNPLADWPDNNREDLCPDCLAKAEAAEAADLRTYFESDERPLFEWLFADLLRWLTPADLAEIAAAYHARTVAYATATESVEASLRAVRAAWRGAA